MQELLHLLVVHRAQHTALATWCGRAWLLPILVAPESTRSVTWVSGWLKTLGVRGEVVGQWLGRVSASSGNIDWLVPVDVGDLAAPSGSSNVQWTLLPSLQRSESLLDYQGWALAQTLSKRAPRGMPSVSGPFGDLNWRHDAVDWVCRVLGDAPGYACPEIVTHRAGSHEVVLELRRNDRRWFFKGLAEDRVREATVTSAFAQSRAESFARTVAVESRPDGGTWWLMEECPGVPLIERLTVDSASRAVEAYAGVQRAMASRIVADREMPSIDLVALASWANRFLTSEGDEQTSAASRALIDEACGSRWSDVPVSWVAPDLDPTNVIVDGEEIRFIDLDDALIGPAPLGVGTFVRRVARALGPDAWSPQSSARLVDAYERAWVPCLQLSALWPAIDLVSDLLECELAWRRVEAKVARGEVHGVIDIARRSICHRLLRAVERYRAIELTLDAAPRRRSRQAESLVKRRPRESPRDS